MDSEIDAARAEDNFCESCKWWSSEEQLCYAEDPGSENCFESAYEEVI